MDFSCWSVVKNTVEISAGDFHFPDYSIPCHFEHFLWSLDVLKSKRPGAKTLSLPGRPIAKLWNLPAPFSLQLSQLRLCAFPVKGKEFQFGLSNLTLFFRDEVLFENFRRP